MATQRPTEAWLRSRSHQRVAEAMTLCQHPAGFCFADASCHRDGACFEIPTTIPARIIAITHHLRDIADSCLRLERALGIHEGLAYDR